MMDFWESFEEGVIPGGGVLLGIGVGRRDVGAPKLDERLWPRPWQTVYQEDTP